MLNRRLGGQAASKVSLHSGALESSEPVPRWSGPKETPPNHFIEGIKRPIRGGKRKNPAPAALCVSASYFQLWCVCVKKKTPAKARGRAAGPSPTPHAEEEKNGEEEEGIDLINAAFTSGRSCVSSC